MLYTLEDCQFYYLFLGHNCVLVQFQIYPFHSEFVASFPPTRSHPPLSQLSPVSKQQVTCRIFFIHSGEARLWNRINKFHLVWFVNSRNQSKALEPPHQTYGEVIWESQNISNSSVKPRFSSLDSSLFFSFLSPALKCCF